MLSIVKQTLEWYTKFGKAPQIEDLKIEDTELLKQKGSLFVTLYEKGEIRGSAGNIQNIHDSIISEIMDNTVAALKDNRFQILKFEDISNIKIRVDLIKERKILAPGELLQLDPVISGILAIKKDYEKMACILPNINHSLLVGEDYIPVLKMKLNESEFKESDYILYDLTTEVLRDF